MHEEIPLCEPSFFERIADHPVPGFVLRQFKYLGMGALIVLFIVLALTLVGVVAALIGQTVSLVLGILGLPTNPWIAGGIVVLAWTIGFVYSLVGE